jgi:hypothetical protein
VRHLSASFLEGASAGDGVFYLLGETVDPVARFLTSKVFSVAGNGAATPMQDGRPFARTPLSQGSALTCDGDGVVIGNDRLFGLDPRTLHATWSVSGVARPVTAVGATHDEIVYFTPRGARSVRPP